MKKRIAHSYPNLIFYCVRGNHEERPSNLINVTHIFDKNVQGIIAIDPDYPHIRYLEDGFVYIFELRTVSDIVSKFMEIVRTFEILE